MITARWYETGIFVNTVGKKINKQHFHGWKIIPIVLLKDMGGVSLFHSNLALLDACELKIDNYPEFYKSIVDLWIKSWISLS